MAHQLLGAGDAPVLPDGDEHSRREEKPNVNVSARALWHSAPPPHRSLSIVVGVPVRNEAEGLGSTLRSLAAQTELDGSRFDPSRFEVLLLVNNCTDESARIAGEFAMSQPDLPLHIEDIHLPPVDAHIGHVRRLLMDAACIRLAAVGAARGIVANTDGDTQVDSFWLARTRQEFELGADAVGGRITLDPYAPIHPGTLRRQRCDAAYRLALALLESLLDPDAADPWPRHHQHFGASLAVARDAYLKVGGVPPVRYLEDEALVGALRRADMRVRHSPRVRVLTSPRCDGRAEVGLSWQLREWRERHGSDAPMTVDDPDHIAAEIKVRRLLRGIWRSGRTGRWKSTASAVERCFGVSENWLRAAADSADTFGALWADLMACRPSGRLTAQTPVREAIDRLHALIHAHGGSSVARSNTSSL